MYLIYRIWHDEQIWTLQKDQHNCLVIRSDSWNLPICFFVYKLQPKLTASMLQFPNSLLFGNYSHLLCFLQLNFSTFYNTVKCKQNFLPSVTTSTLKSVVSMTPSCGDLTDQQICWILFFPAGQRKNGHHSLMSQHISNLFTQWNRKITYKLILKPKKTGRYLYLYI